MFMGLQPNAVNTTPIRAFYGKNQEMKSFFHFRLQGL
jgi:hypothetical protein